MNGLIAAPPGRSGRRTHPTASCAAGRAHLARDRKRASGAVSVHEPEATEKSLHETAATEHEHDELVAVVGVRARDDDDAVAVRLGELHFAERRLARDRASCADLRAAAQLGDAQLAVADAVDEQVVAVREVLRGVRGRACCCARRAAHRRRPTGIHCSDGCCRDGPDAVSELRPGPVGELLRPLLPFRPRE